MRGMCAADLATTFETATEQLLRLKKQVRGLVLSTPVETIPILVTYDAVRGGIFFHPPPLHHPSLSGAPQEVVDAEGGDEDTREEDFAARLHAAQFAHDDDDHHEEQQKVTVHLENAFPGRLAVSGVSLRSSASWEARLEGMASNGPFVRATLTRRDVPASGSGGGRAEGEGGAYADAGSNGVVEVSFVKKRTAAGTRGG